MFPQSLRISAMFSFRTPKLGRLGVAPESPRSQSRYAFQRCFPHPPKNAESGAALALLSFVLFVPLVVEAVPPGVERASARR